MSKLAAVRIRGGSVRGEVKDTLKMLRLTRPNHCTLVDDDPSSRGMLQKVKESVAWGPIEPGVLEELFRKRGELDGGRPVTEDRIREETPYETLGEFSEAVCSEDSDLGEVEGLKRVFRLRPPKKGYRSSRRPTGLGGALGDRGEKINDLILRML